MPAPWTWTISSIATKWKSRNRLATVATIATTLVPSDAQSRDLQNGTSRTCVHPRAAEICKIYWIQSLSSLISGGHLETLETIQWDQLSDQLLACVLCVIRLLFWASLAQKRLNGSTCGFHCKNQWTILFHMTPVPSFYVPSVKFGIFSYFPRFVPVFTFDSWPERKRNVLFLHFFRIFKDLYASWVVRRRSYEWWVNGASLEPNLKYKNQWQKSLMTI